MLSALPEIQLLREVLRPFDRYSPQSSSAGPFEPHERGKDAERSLPDLHQSGSIVVHKRESTRFQHVILKNRSEPSKSSEPEGEEKKQVP